MGDLPDIIGSVSVGIKDGAPALVFNGPDVPGLSGVGTTMIVSYDKDKRRVQVRAGFSHDDDSMTVDLTSLPAEWQRLTSPNTRPATATLPTPRCAALKQGSDFMSYEEYQRMVRMGRTPLPSSRPFDPLDPGVLRQAAMAVIYPPLTRAAFNQIVAFCRGQQILGR